MFNLLGKNILIYNEITNKAWGWGTIQSECKRIKKERKKLQKIVAEANTGPILNTLSVRYNSYQSRYEPNKKILLYAGRCCNR